MNERIKALIEQSTTQYQDGNGEYIDQVDTEKLTQLLLFECIKIAIFNGDAATGQAIKRHFEVEA